MMRNPPSTAVAVVLGLSTLWGCGRRDGDDQTPTTGGYESGFDDGFPSSSGEEAGEAGSSGGESGGDRLDLGGEGGASMSGGAESSADGCDKVDFLFVIDSSGSMQDEQQNLANSFPGFISAIQSTLTAQDYQILVADTDAAANGEICQTICMLGFIPDCMGIPCSMIPPASAASECDRTLGGGHVTDLNGGPCPIMGTQRYLFSSQPDLTGTFSCLARVGTLGDGNEQQAGAAVAAVSPALVGAGGCNAGFLRDDAILVVTIITDEEDGPNDGGDDDTSSMGTPATWKQALVDAKLGNERAVVVLGLIGDGDIGGMCPPLTDGNTGAEPAPNLRSFVESFELGSTGSVCSADYAPFLQTAISVIDTACDDFTPPR